VTSPRTIQTRSPRTGLGLLVLLAFVLFAFLKSIFILVEYTGGGAGLATERTLHLIAYQAVANIAFTAGAALALAGLLDRRRDRSWRLVIGAVIVAATGFGLLFVEVQMVPSLTRGTTL
jgi:uncharacterized BrkB/YihY/UPF0761 family membrane protein